MRTILIAALLTIFSSVDSFSFDAYRIRVVQTMMDSAKTQADLNVAAKMLFDIWDDELKKKEAEAARSMPNEQQSRFKESMRLWKIHVEDMSTLRADLFKQDFMEPRYYKLKGIDSKTGILKKANSMKPYVYNMSKAIYYKEKWVELDILINTR